MRHLTTVQGSFHGRVLAARLGAEGILVQLRGLLDGPYPLQSAVEIFVDEEQLDFAREVLLADAVDDAVDDHGILAEYEQTDDDGSAAPEFASHARRGRLAVAAVVMLVVVLMVVGVVTVAR